MIKKLLNYIISIFLYDCEKNKIEKYLSQSHDLADLEYRIKELDRSGIYNKYLI